MDKQFNLYNNPSIIETLNELNNINGNTNINNAYRKKYISYIEETNKKNSIVNDSSNIECPFFIPEEVEQLKDYYYTSGEETYLNYFNEASPLPNSSEGASDNTSKSWNKRIIELQDKLNYIDDPEEKDKIKQNLVDLGWNPEIEYNIENQIKARKRYLSIISEKMNNRFIDIQSVIENNSITDSLNESNIVNKIYPVHIILVKGDSMVAPIISKVTNSKYTHAALAFNNEYNKLYSFNFDNKFNHGGGFSLESIKEYPLNNDLAVFTFFVNEENYKKLSIKVQEELLNIKNTKYSVFNLITFPFKLFKSDNINKMICSQFIDYCMKLIDADITNIPSFMVSPKTLYTKSIDNNKIYKTYEGLVKNFNIDKTTKFINKLSKTALMINESNNTNLINDYLSPEIIEEKKVPIEIKNNGDILLTKPFVDFDAEYMASHKLLKQYSKIGNIEPMKYELARLYYMNYILEKKLYHNKFLKNKEKNTKTRARVLNDFNKYIKVVLKVQPEFNFGKYYEQTSFYPHTIEINGTTIHKLKDIIGCIL